ncbi:MAG: FAD-binding oxidoreductase [Rhodocyclaceae bacterium]|nr:MAG: FAD-binding oxidoreductase [Rhodocyclaceae bacterium]
MNNDHSSSRRRTLKQLVGMTALGALNSLHATHSLAAGPKPPRLSIPGVGGKVIRRQDPDYELWRQSMVWHQSKPKRYPDVIVQARNDKDVVAAVKYAARKRLKIAVRSGGHNSSGASLRDGGMLIDVSAMSAIRIDAAKQIAHVQPGTRALGLVQAARDAGLSFPVPHGVGAIKCHPTRQRRLS